MSVRRVSLNSNITSNAVLFKSSNYLLITHWGNGEATLVTGNFYTVWSLQSAYQKEIICLAICMSQPFKWLHRLLQTAKSLANLRILECPKGIATFNIMITLLCFAKVSNLQLHFGGNKMKIQNKKIWLSQLNKSLLKILCSTSLWDLAGTNFKMMISLLILSKN